MPLAAYQFRQWWRRFIKPKGLEHSWHSCASSFGAHSGEQSAIVNTIPAARWAALYDFSSRVTSVRTNLRAAFSSMLLSDAPGSVLNGVSPRVRFLLVFSLQVEALLATEDHERVCWLACLVGPAKICM
jgi:hypothetical protein